MARNLEELGDLGDLTIREALKQGLISGRSLPPKEQITVEWALSRGLVPVGTPVIWHEDGDDGDFYHDALDKLRPNGAEAYVLGKQESSSGAYSGRIPVQFYGKKLA